MSQFSNLYWRALERMELGRAKRQHARFWARGADFVDGEGWVLRDRQAVVPMSMVYEMADEKRALVAECEKQLAMAFARGAHEGWHAAFECELGFQPHRSKDEADRRWPIPPPPTTSEDPPTQPTVTSARGPDETADETPSRRRQIKLGAPTRRKIT